MKILYIQLAILTILVTTLIIAYPKTELSVSGNSVKFDSLNTNIIIISQSPDFENPRYIDLSELTNNQLDLPPGTYYYKSANSFIKGFPSSFEITENQEKIEIHDFTLSIKNNSGKLEGTLKFEEEQK